MKPALCTRCGHYWATTIDRTDPNHSGWTTGRICPNCIPHISHTLADDTPTIPRGAA